MRVLLGCGIGSGPAGLVQQGVARVKRGENIPVAELFCFPCWFFADPLTLDYRGGENLPISFLFLR